MPQQPIDTANRGRCEPGIGEPWNITLEYLIRKRRSQLVDDSVYPRYGYKEDRYG